MIEKRGFLIVAAIILVGLVFALIFFFNTELKANLSGFSFAKINFYSWITLNETLKPIFSYLLIAIFLSIIVLVFLISTFLKLKKKTIKVTKEKKVLTLNEERTHLVRKARTFFDELYEMIREKKKVKIYEISRKFKISKEKSIEWCKILQEQGLIEINYSIFSEPEVEIMHEKA